MFNIKVQCYQNISQVLLTSAFMLWPPCTSGFGIREKIRCGLRFFGVFLCGFAVFGPPLRPPQPFLTEIMLSCSRRIPCSRSLSETWVLMGTIPSGTFVAVVSFKLYLCITSETMFLMLSFTCVTLFTAPWRGSLYFALGCQNCSGGFPGLVRTTQYYSAPKLVWWCLQQHPIVFSNKQIPWIS